VVRSLPKWTRGQRCHGGVLKAVRTPRHNTPIWRGSFEINLHRPATMAAEFEKVIHRAPTGAIPRISASQICGDILLKIVCGARKHTGGEIQVGCGGQMAVLSESSPGADRRSAPDESKRHRLFCYLDQSAEGPAVIPRPGQRKMPSNPVEMYYAFFWGVIAGLEHSRRESCKSGRETSVRQPPWPIPARAPQLKKRVRALLARVIVATASRK